MLDRVGDLDVCPPRSVDIERWAVGQKEQVGLVIDHPVKLVLDLAFEHDRTELVTNQASLLKQLSTSRLLWCLAGLTTTKQQHAAVIVDQDDPCRGARSARSLRCHNSSNTMKTSSRSSPASR